MSCIVLSVSDVGMLHMTWRGGGFVVLLLFYCCCGCGCGCGCDCGCGCAALLRSWLLLLLLLLLLRLRLPCFIIASFLQKIAVRVCLASAVRTACACVRGVRRAWRVCTECEEHFCCVCSHS